MEVAITGRNLEMAIKIFRKKAQKEGVLVELSLKNEKSQQLIENTFLKQNMYYDKSVLHSIFSEFNTHSNSISFTSCHNGSAIATVFCVYDNHVAYYILGGYDNENKHEGAGALAMWEAIKFAKKK